MIARLYLNERLSIRLFLAVRNQEQPAGFEPFCKRQLLEIRRPKMVPAILMPTMRISCNPKSVSPIPELFIRVGFIMYTVTVH